MGKRWSMARGTSPSWHPATTRGSSVTSPVSCSTGRATLTTPRGDGQAADQRDPAREPWIAESPAWKARPVLSSRPDGTPMAQVSPAGDRPLLSVGDRQLPVLRARGGQGRRGPTEVRRGGDGHKLNRRVRAVRDDHLASLARAPARDSGPAAILSY